MKEMQNSSFTTGYVHACNGVTKTCLQQQRTFPIATAVPKVTTHDTGTQKNIRAKLDASMRSMVRMGAASACRILPRTFRNGSSQHSILTVAAPSITSPANSCCSTLYHHVVGYVIMHMPVASRLSNTHPLSNVVETIPVPWREGHATCRLCDEVSTRRAVCKKLGFVIHAGAFQAALYIRFSD
jgi:hypothetical protein